ncbi:hypothetical protein CONLIGDRAFT_649611 [Coniochaeta ligniaria NRRL 30616]|uniref:Uncharacterized protein n=1 Tax=Coniochaeta ligniaria NRRL 30616 TaxID=1408157 RepID=A0A1J7J148_9PEZI|nr:hypothetical protein CONLIGDRAFT_649611 [Coniochaeta ligniaria NRRL 30616]
MTVLSIDDTGPASWLFYIVASVGPGGSYRQLAVTLLEATATSDHCGSNLIRPCLNIVTILSDAANQLAIQGELRLAEEFYKDGHKPPRAELPESNASPGILELEGDGPEHGWDRGLREFPFLSACLLLGAGYDPVTGASYDVRTEPLGTAYRDDNLEYGMVILDISDLDEIRYGIVGFTVHFMADVIVGNDDVGYDPVEDLPPEDDPIPTVEEHRPRVPLSARGYMIKFGFMTRFDSSGFAFQTMDKFSLVDARVLDCVWPIDALDLHPVDVEVRPHQNSKSTLEDRAIVSLIGSTQEQDSFDMSIFDTVLLLPSFPSSLLRLMEAHPDLLGPTRSAGQLLKLAYAGRTHLDWTPYKHLSADGIAAALDSPDLAGAESLVFRLGSSCGNTTQLAASLPQLSQLQQLCVLQDPTRTDDTPSAELFAHLSAAADPRTHRLLQSARIVFTGAHSASLRKNFWLTTTTYTPAVHAFPVQQMFVRHQLPANTAGTPRFWPNHIYLGESPLSPQDFAAGFLSILRSITTFPHRLVPSITPEAYLFALATAPPDLTPPLRASITPIPAEAFSIPLRPSPTHQQAECWSLPRDLAPGGWTVLISHDHHYNAAAAAENARDHHQRPTEARTIRYVFVRARERVAFTHLSPREIREDLDLGPDKIDVVCGLDTFLRETAPPGTVVDAALCQRRVEEVARDLASQPQQAKLGAGVEWLAVLGREEACDMLRDFLEDAAFVRRNLRVAMEEDPEGRNWYPELLREGSRHNESETRNQEVFRSLRQ